METKPKTIKAPELGSSFTKLTPESTSVAKIAYNAETAVFSITFKTNGSVYDYRGVSHEDALKAWNSDSMGKLPRVELSAYKGVRRD